MTYPSPTQRTGVFNFGRQTDYAFFFGDVQSAELWVGLQGEWTSRDSPSAPAGVGALVRGDDFGVRAQGGINFVLNPALSAALQVPQIISRLGGVADWLQIANQVASAPQCKTIAPQDKTGRITGL